MPGHTHRVVHRQHDHPDHGDHDLERRHDPDQVGQRGLRQAVEQAAQPRREREVKGGGVAGILAEPADGVLRTAQHQDAQADPEDDRLDEVALPHRGAVEAAARSALAIGRTARAVGDERDDRHGHHDGEELGDPLVEEEGAQERDREVRVEELTVGGDQGEEEQPEADEHEPVAHPDRGPLQHPGVGQRLLEHRAPACTLVGGPVRRRLSEPHHRDDVPDRLDEQGDRHHRDGQRHHDGDDLDRVHACSSSSGQRPRRA